VLPLRNWDEANLPEPLSMVGPVLEGFAAGKWGHPGGGASEGDINRGEYQLQSLQCECVDSGSKIRECQAISSKQWRQDGSDVAFVVCTSPCFDKMFLRYPNKSVDTGSVCVRVHVVLGCTSVCMHACMWICVDVSVCKCVDV
jgi:hypothetical protein